MDLDQVRRRIKQLESQGQTGRTNAELHRWNCTQTAALSFSEAKALLYQRVNKGKPVGKLAAYLTQNNVSF